LPDEFYFLYLFFKKGVVFQIWAWYSSQLENTRTTLKWITFLPHWVSIVMKSINIDDKK